MGKNPIEGDFMNSPFLSWDGKSTDFLVDLYTHTTITTSIINDWLTCANESDQKCQRGATWLIKETLKSGNKFSSEETILLLDTFMCAEDWETRLHILQCFKYLDLTLYSSDKLYEALKFTLHSDVKFLRAWSYDAFYRLALADKNYQPLFHDQLTWGTHNESGAITARIRTIVREINHEQQK